MNEYTVAQLKDMIRIEKKNNPSCVSYSSLNKEGLYNLALELGLIGNPRGITTTNKEKKGRNKNIDPIKKINEILLKIHTSDIPESKRRKMIKKTNDLKNNWTGSVDDIEKLKRYSDVLTR